jgi:hypothetical protein
LSGLKSYFREKEFLFLAALGIVFFFPPLFLNKTFFYGDLYLYFFSEKKLLAALLRAGEFPLWNPFLHGGQPLFANLNNGVLYPSNLLFWLFPLFTALNIDIVFHLIWCAVAAYLLARTIGFKPLPAFAVAIVYGYCGYTLSLGNLYNRLLAAPYIPLLLLCWHQYGRTNTRRWFMYTVLCASLQFFAGAPEISVISFACLFVWSLAYEYPDKSRSQLLASWVLLSIWAVGLCAVQLIPTAQLVAQSPRSAIDSYEAFTQFSLSPKRLPEILVPGFLGSKEHLQSYWGNELEPTGTPFIWSLYLGFPVLLLGAYGAFVRTDDADILPRRVRLLLFLAMILGVVLSLGKYSPGYRFVYELPVLHWFRYPVKFMHAAILPAALLTGWSIQQLMRQRPSQRFLWIVSAIAILWALAAVVFQFFPVISLQAERFLFGQANQIMTAGLSHSIWHSAVILLLAASAFWIASKSAHFAWMLVPVIAADLLAAGISVNPYLPRSTFQNEPPVVKRVRESLADGRFYRPESKQIKLRADSDDIFKGIRWDLQTLNWYTAAYYQIPLIYNASFETLETADILQLKLLAATLPWDKRTKLLSAGSVSIVLTPDAISLPGWNRIDEVQNTSSTRFFLYANRNAAPKVGIFNTGAIAHSMPQAMRILFHPQFDPQKHVILQSPGPRPQPCTGPQEAPVLHKLVEGFSESSYVTETTCDAYVSTTIPYYDGWRAAIDGKRVPLIRANAAFFAVFLPAGKHLVRFSYFPNSLLAGAVVSILFLLSLPFTASMTSRSGKPELD